MNGSKSTSIKGNTVEVPLPAASPSLSMATGSLFLEHPSGGVLFLSKQIWAHILPRPLYQHTWEHLLHFAFSIKMHLGHLSITASERYRVTYLTIPSWQAFNLFPNVCNYKQCHNCGHTRRYLLRLAEQGAWSCKVWVWILALPPTSCVALGKVLNLSVLQFPHL